MIDPRSVSPSVYEAEAVQLGIRKPNVRPILSAVIGKGMLDPADWSKEGLIQKNLADNSEPLPQLRLESQRISKIDGFKKLILRTSDDLLIETVIIPLHKKNRVTVCLSSQIGCVMGCTFCATARMAQRRNLQSWEILDQMRHARSIAESAGQIVTGAVFMGMGEPFLNYASVMVAAEHLCYPVLNAISAKAITVSTVGIVDKIDQFTQERRPFRLSISLGAATDEKRARLVPVAARSPLKEVLTAARRYSEHRKERVNLSYVCISGENISDEDARKLGRAIGDLPIRLDLIEVTDPTGRYQPPSEAEMNSFRDALNIHLRQPVVRRYSGGADIQAACGTLAGNNST